MLSRHQSPAALVRAACALLRLPCIHRLGALFASLCIFPILTSRWRQVKPAALQLVRIPPPRHSFGFATSRSLPCSFRSQQDEAMAGCYYERCTALRQANRRSAGLIAILQKTGGKKKRARRRPSRLHKISVPISLGSYREANLQQPLCDMRWNCKSSRWDLEKPPCVTCLASRSWPLVSFLPSSSKPIAPLNAHRDCQPGVD